MTQQEHGRGGRVSSRGIARLLIAVFAMAVMLVTIYVFRHIQGDPIERQRLNPEERPSAAEPAR